MIGWPNLRYELIGRVVVATVAVVIALAILIAAVILATAAWVRGWQALSNRMYKGYDAHPKEDRPPLWKMRIAAVSLALARFKFRKIPAAYRECHDLAHDKTTLREHLKAVFGGGLNV